MNLFSGVGRITTDLKLQYTSDNKHEYCKFTIAIDNPISKSADFINCIIWEKAAKNLCEYQRKGSLISIVGKLHTYSFTTPSGEKRYSYEIDVKQLNYLESKKEVKEETKESYEEDPFMEYQKKIENEVIIDDSFLD